MQDVLMKVWLNITFCSPLSKDVHVCYHHYMLLNFMLFFTGLELLTCMHKNTFSIGCGTFFFFFSKRSDSDNDIPLKHVSEWKKCWKRSQCDD